MADDRLELALRDLGGALAFPSAPAPGRPDLATRARATIVERGVRPGNDRRGIGERLGIRRPLRRSLVLAIALLLVLAAIAGAVGLGLPGLRIVFGDLPSPTPATATSAPTGSPLAPLGSRLGLGSPLPLQEVERLAGIDLILPTDPAIGPPDVAYLAGERAALVWAESPSLPAPAGSDIGLLLSEFRGHTEGGYFEKLLDSGTTVTPVTVDGAAGYWISGDPHFFYYVDEAGEMVDDTHRAVGDTLVWTVDGLTYRLESGLDMEDAIRLAESLD